MLLLFLVLWRLKIYLLNANLSILMGSLQHAGVNHVMFMFNICQLARHTKNSRGRCNDSVLFFFLPMFFKMSKKYPTNWNFDLMTVVTPHSLGFNIWFTVCVCVYFILRKLTTLIYCWRLMRKKRITDIISSVDITILWKILLFRYFKSDRT